MLDLKPTGIVLVVALAVFAGQSCARPASHDVRKQPAEKSVDAQGPRADESTTGAGTQPVRTAAASTAATAAGLGARRRPPPTGRPAPDRPCGHAIAFAGWLPHEEHVRDQIFVCDPGDNAPGKGLHVWEPRLRPVSVHYGLRRPVVMLTEGGPYTLMGAVLLVPREGVDEAARLRETRAVGMPDLSQDFNPRWSGLCGPTALADVLFSIEAHGTAVLGGIRPGVDSAAEAFIAGADARISPSSLAARMGLTSGDTGATNQAICNGASSWLQEHQPGTWQASLAWLDDTQRPPQTQRDYLGRLAAAIEAGGGAVLCLWPGAEFSDSAVMEGRADSGRPPASDGKTADGMGGDGGRRGGPPALPDAAFPTVPSPPPPRKGPSLPGRPVQAVDAATLVRDGRKKLEAARSRRAQGQRAAAFELAQQAVVMLDGAAAAGGECRKELEEAIKLCRTLEAGQPQDVPSERVTIFQ